MQLEQTFLIPVPVQDAWRVLLDIEQVATCMPGASLDSVEGDEFTGTVKVKLGPIALTYAGKASFLEKDEAGHRVVIDARGKDRRGNGTAAAVVTARLTDDGEATRVDVVTDLNITGRPAQFGRGAMNDVADKLLGQFADQLTARLSATEETPVAAETTPGSPGAAAQGPGTAAVPLSPVADSIDLLQLAGGSLAERVRLPAVAASAIAVLVITAALLSRRARRSR